MRDRGWETGPVSDLVLRRVQAAVEALRAGVLRAVVRSLVCIVHRLPCRRRTSRHP
ncbi:hypothetical protein [Streptomyces sp. FH025]|uniref:hypothetical protein n=1 Tax=Streptomyces sp. FH025 TaxID=2815937 RepID=UPI001A9FA405|nr:hypothetical protein [Streptomyces sp. FH025]MBO1417743.1 hypothetical protein [Streptomyces sp. FH025]